MCKDGKVIRNWTNRIEVTMILNMQSIKLRESLGRGRHFFSGHSGFSSTIIQLGFMAFTEWFGILYSDVLVVVMDLTRIFVFWWRGVGIHGGRQSRGRIPPTGPSFVHVLRGNQTFIHILWVSASKPSFPTSIEGIVTILVLHRRDLRHTSATSDSCRTDTCIKIADCNVIRNWINRIEIIAYEFDCNSKIREPVMYPCQSISHWTLFLLDKCQF